MPTVLWLGALRVVIDPIDHRPAHVHVMGQRHEAVFELKIPRGAVSLREYYGFTQSGLAAIERGLVENLAGLLEAWERIHGTR